MAGAATSAGSGADTGAQRSPGEGIVGRHPRLRLRRALVPEAVVRSCLDATFPAIMAAFEPQVFKYSNTNPDIKKETGATANAPTGR